jgi:hypothetical protein
MIHVTIEGFGLLVEAHRPDPRHPERQRTAYYNTTGIAIGDKVCPRSRVFGQLRFNGVGGFIAAGVERNIGRVFQCSAELHGLVRKLVFHHLLAKPPQVPDFFLFVVTSGSAGLLSIESDNWKSDGVVLFALSQSQELQEAILLMPRHSWLRGGLSERSSQIRIAPDRARHAAPAWMTRHAIRKRLHRSQFRPDMQLLRQVVH